MFYTKYVKELGLHPVAQCSAQSFKLKENSFKLYFWHEIRLSTHREQFGEGRRPLRAI